MARRRFPNRTHYSRHFSRAELDCHCHRHGDGPKKHGYRVRRRLRRLAVNLERMRRAYGRPIAIRSGYRCPAHNAFVKGASQSQHMQARAADVVSTKATQRALKVAANSVRAFRNGGIGTYPDGSLHVDYRPWYARWTSY